MNPRKIQILLGLVGYITVMSLTMSAHAQCAGECNQLTKHWTFSNIGSSADVIEVGMVWYWWGPLPNPPTHTNSRWVPAVCENNVLYLVQNVASYGSSVPQLTADSSMCLGGGDDHVYILTGSDTACDDRLVAFDPNGWDFMVNLESGVDGVHGNGYDGDLRLCGGNGNDRIYGGDGADYISGQANNDHIFSSPGSDILRGYTGNDVIEHTSSPGTDYLQGWDGNDCVNVTGPVNPTSSCNDGSDYYDSDGVSLTSCTTPTINCCSLSGVNC